MNDTREASLRQLLSEKPRHARAMAQLACLLAETQPCDQLDDLPQQQGHKRTREALSWAKKSVDIAPHQPFGHAALSVLMDDHASRMESARRAINLCDGKKQHDVALTGLLVRCLVEPREYEAKCIRLGTASTSITFSTTVRPLSAEEEQIYDRIKMSLSRFWCQTIIIVKERVFLALREYRLGLFFRKMVDSTNRSRAISSFRDAVDHLPSEHPNVDLSYFWLATLSSSDLRLIHKCPADYVIGLYSTFAPRFDKLLVEKLCYRTPSALRQLLDETINSDTKGRRVFPAAADLGCGTGLSGLAFASCISDTLVGVDLSPQMLIQAEQRKCYHRLVSGDLTSILTDSAQYDLVFACDVFCYIGDLSDIFALTNRSLVDSGMFGLSTELLPESADVPYALHECARFAHKESYIHNLARETKFHVRATKVCPIRKNLGKDVIGLLVILCKQQSALSILK